ncbi:MAG TPA: hypothetical protein DEO86_18070 [Colwellia sp.]|nr:hypothetical protein [Colwellia sp.]
MSVFIFSQLLILVAIFFDLASFQFKKRKQIVSCLCIAGILIFSHFILLEQWTAAGLMAIATIRYFVSIFTTSKHVMFTFLFCSLIVFMFTFMGTISFLCFAGSVFQTVASFSKNDKKLRQLMIIGTSFWLLHNFLIGSPVAVVMEVLFISSNLVGYYRFYVTLTGQSLKSN